MKMSIVLLSDCQTADHKPKTKTRMTKFGNWEYLHQERKWEYLHTFTHFRFDLPRHVTGSRHVEVHERADL
jgi:hypothetical protein